MPSSSTPAALAGPRSPAPAQLQLAAVPIWPFSCAAPPSSLATVPAMAAFRAWAREHAVHYPAAAGHPSPAALRVFALVHAPPSHRLVLSLVPTPPTATLQLSLLLPVPLDALSRSSDALRRILWHVAHKPPTPTPLHPPDAARDICGFVHCAARCRPSPSRAQFRLDRVFAACTTAAAAATSSSSSFDAPSPPPPHPNFPASLPNLPDELLFRIVRDLSPTDLPHLALVSRSLAAFVRPIIPALRLRLFDHQHRAVRRMLRMESAAVCGRRLPVPLLHRLGLPGQRGCTDVCVVVDLVDGTLNRLTHMPYLTPPRGGLFCDEPGLGKTITALALVLKTLGTEPRLPDGVSAKEEIYFENGGGVDTLVKGYREALPGRYRAFGDNEEAATRKAKLFPFSPMHGRRSSGRQVSRPDFLGTGKGRGSLPAVEGGEGNEAMVYLTHATLIVVPNVLTGHWERQIDLHVDKDKLRVLVITSPKNFPDDAAYVAASYDVVLASFEAIGELFRSVRSGTPVLMRLHFLRIIVDEGHTLSRANVSDFQSACSRLRAERRWVMTGTPTPSTSRSDVDHLHALLRFIREEGYGLDKRAWTVGIRDPYVQYRPESLERLHSLLSAVMIREDKSVLESSCHVRNVILDFEQQQADSYNWLVSLTRRNLITSDWFSEKHAESLLNGKNLKMAQRALQNLRFACTLSGTQVADFTSEDVVHAIDELYEKHFEKAACSTNDRFDDPITEWPLLELQVSTDERILRKQADIRARVDLLLELEDENIPYSRLSRTVKIPGKGNVLLTRVYSGILHDVAESFFQKDAFCASCHGRISLPMVAPCAHLLCENCIVLDKTQCVACKTAYHLDKHGVPEDLIELQPAAYSKNQWQPNWESMQSAKVSYLMRRLRELPMNVEWTAGKAEPIHRRPKVIIHSQFADHLYAVAVQLKKSGDFTDAYVEMALNRRDMVARGEVGTHGTAAEYARNSVTKFTENADVHILLMSSRHGSVGLDLSFVQYIFMLEPVWDASSELQIVSRAHRIGARKDIYVERLAMRGSVEHMMVKDLEKRLVDGYDENPESDFRTKKDLSRVREMLRNLQPVTVAQDPKKKSLIEASGSGDVARSREGEAGSSADGPRKRACVSGDETKQRNVRFRVE